MMRPEIAIAQAEKYLALADSTRSNYEWMKAYAMLAGAYQEQARLVMFVELKEKEDA